MATHGILLKMERREYNIKVSINSVAINKVIIDPHYEEKHAESVDDKIILQLVKQLDGQTFEPDDEDGPYRYYVIDQMRLAGKLYKLVWLLEDDALYIGVINAYRRK